MNFDLDTILQPFGGNNANARVVSLRVMNDRAPTPKQLAELQHRFALHKLNVRTSVAGFLTRDGVMSDGSRFRFVSNSGMHQLMIWPVSPEPVDLAKLPWGVLSIPADTTHQFGWTSPPVEGTNGTTVSSGNLTQRGLAGASFLLARNERNGKFEGKNFKRHQSYPQPAARNVAFFSTSSGFLTAFNQSAQQYEPREWWDEKMKVLITTVGATEQVRVNGVEFGGGAGSIWACIYDFDDGSGPAPHLLGVRINGNTLTIMRKAISAGAGSGGWSDFGSIVLTTLDAAAISDSSNSFLTRYDWIKKVVVNKSRTTVTVWVQNPNAESLGITTTSFFVGMVDFDTVTGAATVTEAEGEVTRATLTGLVDTYEVSGKRQISVDYDGDDKVFTELRYTGARVISMSHTDNPTNYEFSYTVTDDREVWLHRGNFARKIAWVEVIQGQHTETGSFTPNNPPLNNAGPGSGSFEHHITITYHKAVLNYYGGKGDLFAILEEEVRRDEHIQGDTDVDVMRRAVTFSSWRHRTSYVRAQPRYGRRSQRVVLGSRVMDAGEVTRAATTATTALVQYEPQWDTTFGGSSDSNPTLQKRWGSSLLQDNAQFDTDGSDFRYRVGTPLVVMSSGESLERNGHPSFAALNAADANYMNGRAVNEFAILSVPKLDTTAAYTDGNPRFNPNDYLTYCTDPAILSKHNIDSTLGVLKGIHLK